MLTEDNKKTFVQCRDGLVKDRAEIESKKADLQEQLDALDSSLEEDGRQIEALDILIGGEAVPAQDIVTASAARSEAKKSNVSVAASKFSFKTL